MSYSLASLQKMDLFRFAFLRTTVKQNPINVAKMSIRTLLKQETNGKLNKTEKKNRMTLGPAEYRIWLFFYPPVCIYPSELQVLSLRGNYRYSLV